MQKALPAVGLAAAGLLAAVVLVDPRVPLPPIGPTVERVCADTMQRSAPDLSWVSPGRDGWLRGREITAVTVGELPFHGGQWVRVAGVLHAEFEWVALYPSRKALADGWYAPWVELDWLWPGESYWQTNVPSISDRCVVVEGFFTSGRGGHLGMFNGTIRNVIRLDVWSTPHRPFIGAPTPPPPPPPPL